MKLVISHMINRKFLIILAFVFISATSVLANTSSHVVLSPSQQLEMGKQFLESGKTRKAIKVLELAVKIAPVDAYIQYNLGKAYLEKKKYQKAKFALRKVMRLKPGSDIAKDSNQMLLNMPKKSVAPKLLRIFAKLRGRFLAPAGIAKPRIMNFYTTWAQPCQMLEPVLNTAQKEWGEKIEFVFVDVDDPKNEKLLEQYDISPVPTVVFLNTKGEIVTFLLGYSGEKTVNESINMLISKS